MREGLLKDECLKDIENAAEQRGKIDKKIEEINKSHEELKELRFHLRQSKDLASASIRHAKLKKDLTLDGKNKITSNFLNIYLFNFFFFLESCEMYSQLNFKTRETIRVSFIEEKTRRRVNYPNKNYPKTKLKMN